MNWPFWIVVAMYVAVIYHSPIRTDLKKKFMSIRRNDEIEATAMLLGEQTMICSCCIGRGWERGVFGGRRKCGQCAGTGYDYLGPKTKEALWANPEYRLRTVK